MFDKRDYVVINNETRGKTPHTPFLTPEPRGWREEMLTVGEHVIERIELAQRVVLVTNLRVALFSSGLTRRVIFDFPHDSVTKWVSTRRNGSTAHYPGGKRSLYIPDEDLPRFHAALGNRVKHENRVIPNQPKGLLYILFGI